MKKASLLKMTDKQELGTKGFGFNSGMYCRGISERGRFVLRWLLPIVFLALLMPFMSYGQVIQISNIVDLQKIGNDAGYPLNGQYELTQDIDASDTVNWNSGAGFQPIGTSSNPFTGKFDGKGHKVTGLYINRQTTNYIGDL